MNILVVEDEEKLAESIRVGLEEEGFKADLAVDGEQGVKKAESYAYDLILMDIVMPNLDGLSAIRRIRGKGIRTPILCLTGKSAVEDVVTGLNTGGDGYLIKPFALKELVAHIRSLTRRRRQTLDAELFYAELRLDPVTRKAWRAGRDIPLTTKEYELLEYFLQNAEKVLTREMILKEAWKYKGKTTTNIVDVYMNYLRRKVDKGANRKLIHTVRGIGFVLKDVRRKQIPD